MCNLHNEVPSLILLFRFIHVWKKILVGEIAIQETNILEI